ncbi:type II toxin-antitoxin system Phd/YefM family antitoxin [Pseudolysinimonas kribbensis]|uniref:type II toxin-antitoxin system Phd/YefM family antitoxin n=1 Tax=Pseudolysinimonas kribbensis TaxID=433641 RepID=UPI0024E07749|nr:type II toxin-antitoxin system prevent-host-death family antitoxin [Pseudolysinimonas kribbensis]
MAQVISQREMRNRSGEVLRAVAAGESFIITNDGVEVAELIPRNAPRPKPAPDRPATVPKGTPMPFRHNSPDGPSSQEVLDELRAERF